MQYPVNRQMITNTSIKKESTITQTFYNVTESHTEIKREKVSDLYSESNKLERMIYNVMEN